MSNISLARNAGNFASSKVTGRVLPDVSKPAANPLASLPREQLEAMIAQLMANQAKAKETAPIVKTGRTGSVAFTGIRSQRGGVSLYPHEWLAVAQALPEIIEWIIDDAEYTGASAIEQGGPKIPYTARPSYDKQDKAQVIAGLAEILAKLA